MTDVIQVTKRDKMGSAATRRLRQSGHVPAVLYGHGLANEHLAIPAKQVSGLLRHHSKTVQLNGDVSETALVSEMQWDALGIEVLHLDLIRVNLQEKVEVMVSIHIHGEAPGLREGGILLENLHEVEVCCPAGSIPERLELHVSGLHVGDQAIAGDLELPDGVELLTPAETVIVTIEEPRGSTDDEEKAAASEPEMVAKKADADE